MLLSVQMLMLVGAFASRRPSLAAVAWIPEPWPVDDEQPLTTAAVLHTEAHFIRAFQG